MKKKETEAQARERRKKQYGCDGLCYGGMNDDGVMCQPCGGIDTCEETRYIEAFKYKDNTSTDAARGKVLKASGLKSLQKGNLKAFITKFGSGHVSVVQRKGTSRLPLKKLLSPSIPTMVGNEAKVYGIVKPNIEKNLQKNIQKQIDKILGGK